MVRLRAKVRYDRKFRVVSAKCQFYHRKCIQLCQKISKPNHFLEAEPNELRYVIIGNTHGSDPNSYQLKTWKLEGRKASDGSWIVLDTHSNEQLSPKVPKVFNVSNNEKLTSVRLTQTGKNASGGDNLCINGFDIFGEYEL